MINLIKLQPSLSIVLVAFHARNSMYKTRVTESRIIAFSKVTDIPYSVAKCKAIQILITIDYFNSLRFFHFRVGRRYAVSECPLVSIAIVKYSAQDCLNAVVNTELFAYSFK
jgi:hypothetical protein